MPDLRICAICKDIDPESYISHGYADWHCPVLNEFVMKYADPPEGCVKLFEHAVLAALDKKY